MTALYLIQTNKPRSETGARPIPIFFGLFVAQTVKARKATIRKGVLALSDSERPRKYEAEMIGDMVSDLDMFRACVDAALSTFGDEPRLAIRKKIARIAGDMQADGGNLPELLKASGYFVSVVNI